VWPACGNSTLSGFEIAKSWPATVSRSGSVFFGMGVQTYPEIPQEIENAPPALSRAADPIERTRLGVNISLGGHVGGLVGGALVILALTQFGRVHAAYGRVGAVGIVGVVAVAIASVAIAYARVRGYA
jgi:hypothetical protein